jgi:hypothetical protein
VEAAFIMPIAVFTITAVILLAFYLHDYCLIQGSADRMLHKAGLTMKHEADIVTGKVSYEAINDKGIFQQLADNSKEREDQIHELINQELSNGLFMTWMIDDGVEINKLNVSISIDAKVRITVPVFQKLFDGFSAIHIKGSYPIHNPAETIRCTEVILDTGAEIKGVDSLKKILENLLGTK